MILVIDNRDSFTWNIVHALREHTDDVRVLAARSASLDSIEALEPQGILVGPGPGDPQRAGCSVELIQHLGARFPILGICLGHQAIAAAFGAPVTRARCLVHGSTVEVRHDGGGVFAGLPPCIRATRYNSLTVREADLPPELVVSARADDGDVMALRHATHPIEGVQFHPESVLSEHGSRIFSNWLTRTGALSGAP